MNRLNQVIGHLNTAPPNEPKHCSNSNTSFKYTMPGRMLTNEQRQFYEENGFIVIKKLLNPQEVSTYYNRFDELVANPEKGPSEMVIVRDVSLKGLQKKDRTSENVVTKLTAWIDDSVLSTFAKHNKVIAYVESIIGSDIRSHHHMSINKPTDPGTLSSRHPLHQDQWYFPFAPSEYIVCAWTALQNVNRQNGCLVVVPGTHKRDNSLNIGGKLYAHAYPNPKVWNGPVNKAYHGIQLGSDGKDLLRLMRKRVHLVMEPGDTVFFHPLLIHGSGANLTDMNRRSISVHYCNSNKVEFIPPQMPEQAMIEKESVQMATRLLGRPMTYHEIWKDKSRQIQGDVGCFEAEEDILNFINEHLKKYKNKRSKNKQRNNQ